MGVAGVAVDLAGAEVQGGGGDTLHPTPVDLHPDPVAAAPPQLASPVVLAQEKAGVTDHPGHLMSRESLAPVAGIQHHYRRGLLLYHSLKFPEGRGCLPRMRSKELESDVNPVQMMEPNLALVLGLKLVKLNQAQI